MSRQHYMGEREELFLRKKSIVTEIMSHADSLRHSLPITAEAEDIDSEYLLNLAIAINTKCTELSGVNKKITILNREIG